MRSENKLIIFLKIISLSLIVFIKFFFSEYKYVKKRYRYDIKKRGMKLDYGEESSIGINLLKSGYQKVVYLDIVLRNKKEQKKGRAWLNLPKNIYLGMSLTMLGGIVFKFFCKLAFNIISMILYLILPKKYSLKFDRFILRKVRTIYGVLYRSEWLVIQILYMTFIIIPVYITEIVLYAILFPLAMFIGFIQNPIYIGGFGIYGTGTFFYYQYRFANSWVTGYVLRRLLRIEERKTAIKNGYRNMIMFFVNLKLKIKIKIINFKKRLILLVRLIFKMIYNFILKILNYLGDLIFFYLIGEILWRRQKDIEKICGRLFDGLLDKPIIAYYDVQIIRSKMVMVGCLLLIKILKPVERLYLKFLMNKKRYHLIRYRKFIGQLCNIVEFIMEPFNKKKKNESFFIEFQMEDEEEEQEKRNIYVKNKEKLNKYKVKHGELIKLILKHRYKSNKWIDLLLICNERTAGLRGSKGDSLTANLLMYIANDVKKSKTIEKPKGSINILDIISGIIETEKQGRIREKTIQYKQPDFQTSKINKLKTNSGSIKKIHHIFMKPEYSYYFRKNKNDGGIVLAKLVIFRIKRGIIDGGKGTAMDDDNNLQTMPDGTVVLAQADFEELQNMEDKINKVRLNWSGKKYSEDAIEDIRRNENSRDKIMSMFYIKMIEQKLIYTIEDEAKRGVTYNKDVKDFNGGGADGYSNYYTRSFEYKRARLTKDKRSFLTYFNNRSREGGIDYVLGYTGKDMRLQGGARRSDNMGNRTFLKNKPFIYNILNKIDIYNKGGVRNGELPDNQENFINDMSDIDCYKPEERVKVYRLQQDLGLRNDEFDGDIGGGLDIDKIKNKYLDRIVERDVGYDPYVYLFLDYGYRIYRFFFYDKQLRDYHVSKKTFRKHLIYKYNLNNYSGFTKERGKTLKKLRIGLSFYMQYKYLFNNTANSSKVYKNTLYVFEDYVNDIQEIIKIMFAIFKLKRGIYIIISIIKKLIIIIVRSICKLICRIGFFRSYYVYIEKIDIEK